MPWMKVFVKPTVCCFSGAVRYMVTVVQDIPNDGIERELRTEDNELRVDNLIPGGWYNFTVRSIGRGNRRNLQESPLLRVQTG